MVRKRWHQPNAFKQEITSSKYISTTSMNVFRMKVYNCWKINIHNSSQPPCPKCDGMVFFPTLSDREAREGNTFKFISLVREKTGAWEGIWWYAILELPPCFPKRSNLLVKSDMMGKNYPQFQKFQTSKFTTSTSTQRIQMKYQGPHPQDQPQLIHKLQVCASRI